MTTVTLRDRNVELPPQNPRPAQVAQNLPPIIGETEPTRQPLSSSPERLRSQEKKLPEFDKPLGLLADTLAEMKPANHKELARYKLISYLFYTAVGINPACEFSKEELSSFEPCIIRPNDLFAFSLLYVSNGQ